MGVNNSSSFGASQPRIMERNNRKKAIEHHRASTMIKVGILQPMVYSKSFKDILESNGKLDFQDCIGGIDEGVSKDDGEDIIETLNSNDIYEYFEQIPSNPCRELKRFITGDQNDTTAHNGDMMVTLRDRVRSVMNEANEKRKHLRSIVKLKEREVKEEFNNQPFLRRQFSGMSARNRDKMELYRRIMEENPNLDPLEIERQIICKQLQQYAVHLQQQSPDLVIYVAKEEYSKALNRSSNNRTGNDHMDYLFYHILIKKRATAVSLFGIGEDSSSEVVTPTAYLVQADFGNVNINVANDFVIFGTDYATAVPLCEVVTDDEIDQY
jgi:hypothetical protein